MMSITSLISSQLIAAPLTTIRFALWFLAVAVPAVAAAVPGEPAAATITAEAAARAMVEAPELDEIALSPDGQVVVYSVLTRSIAANEITRTLYVQKLSARAEAPRLGSVLSTRRAERTPALFRPSWVNASDELLIAEPENGVVRLNVRTGLQTAVQALDEAGTLRPFVLPMHPTMSEKLYVSPRGTYLAFVAPGTRRSALDPRRGVLIEPGKPWVWEYDRLCLLDLRSGKVTTLVEGDRYRVSPSGSLSWAPDESAIAFSADTDEDPRAYDGSNLFVAALATRSVRPLVQQPGMDIQPSWSPDGKWIAFRSQRGAWGPSNLAIVPAAGGVVAYLTKDARYNAYPSAYSWSLDSRAVLYAASEQMTYRIYRAALPDASVAAGPPVQVVENVAGFTGPKGLRLYATSFSRDGRRVAFARGQDAGAQELHVADLVDGRVVSSRQISRLDAAHPLAQHVRAEALNWRSHDGKFTVHAVLVTPKAVWRKNRPVQPLPTLVNMKGYGSGWEWSDAFEASPLAARGYAVLIPQVRGRGGNSTAFARGLREAHSYIRVPMEDVFVGLDQLIGQKISDGERLGIYGMSQGGTHSVGIVTMTDRFKAAVSWEAHSDNKLVDSIIISNSTAWKALLPDNQANGDVYDPQELERLERESVGLNLHRVHTPTLLLFGADCYAPTVGRIMQGGLARFGVPSELIVYDEGHGFERPGAFYDARIRTARWFDYWLRDVPYPDADLQQQYDAWKQKAPARTSQ